MIKYLRSEICGIIETITLPFIIVGGVELIGRVDTLIQICSLGDRNSLGGQRHLRFGIDFRGR